MLDGKTRTIELRLELALGGAHLGDLAARLLGFGPAGIDLVGLLQRSLGFVELAGIREPTRLADQAHQLIGLDGARARLVVRRWRRR